MAAPLSLTRATVQTAEARYERASVLIRQNRAVVREGRTVVAEADVVKVTQTGRKTWDVELADGSTWSIQRAAGCGCGGGR